MRSNWAQTIDVTCWTGTQQQIPESPMITPPSMQSFFKIKKCQVQVPVDDRFAHLCSVHSGGSRVISVERGVSATVGDNTAMHQWTLEPCRTRKEQKNKISTVVSKTTTTTARSKQQQQQQYNTILLYCPCGKIRLAAIKKTWQT